MSFESSFNQESLLSNKNKKVTQDYITIKDSAVDTKKLDVKPKDTQDSIKRVVEKYNARYKTPKLQDVPELKSALNLVHLDQKAFDESKKLWNDALVPYTTTKKAIEDLLVKMGNNQSATNTKANEKSRTANEIRNDFIKLEKDFDNLTKLLSTQKSQLTSSFENLNTSLVKLLESKKNFANTVITERKKTWDFIVSWDHPEMKQYETALITQKSEAKNTRDQSLSNSSNVIGAEERNFIKKIIANKSLDKQDTNELDAKTVTFNTTYDLFSKQAIDANKQAYQLSYFNLLNIELATDLKQAMIGTISPNPLDQAYIAKRISQIKPVLNANATLENSKTGGVAIFDYTKYTGGLFALSDAVLIKLESDLNNVASHNTKVEDFIIGLDIKNNSTIQPITQQTNLSLATTIYNNIAKQLNATTGTQTNGKELATKENIEKSSLLAKLLLYKNSIKDYYRKLNTYQQSAQEKIDDKSSTRNEKEKQGEFIMQIRQVRGELYKFGVVELPSALPKDSDGRKLVKDDPVGNIADFKEYNIQSLIDLIPVSIKSIDLPIINDKVKDSQWDKSTNELVIFDTKFNHKTSVNNNVLEENISREKPILAQGFKEELDTIEKLFINFEVTYKDTINKMSQ